MTAACTNEKCIEYQQVAALISLDLDLLHSVSNRQDLTLDDLREHIAYTIEKRDEAVSNAEARKQRYHMTSMLLNLPVADSVEHGEPL